jgi:transcription initiation factor TFIIH subunit 1
LRWTDQAGLAGVLHTYQSKSKTTSWRWTEAIAEKRERQNNYIIKDNRIKYVTDSEAADAGYMPPSVCTAAASYKKLPGVLELNDTHLQWAQDGKGPSVRVAHSEVAGQCLTACPCTLHFVLILSRKKALFSSKEGAAQVRLKVALVGDDTGHSFAFTSPKAQNEREKFKAELTVIVSRNRAASEAAARAPVVPAKPSPVAKPVVAAPQRPIISQTPSRAMSVSSTDQRNVTIIPGNDPATDVRLRKTILMSDPELGALHRELVAISGQLSEAEFWEGREVLSPLLMQFRRVELNYLY